MEDFRGFADMYTAFYESDVIYFLKLPCTTGGVQITGTGAGR